MSSQKERQRIGKLGACGEIAKPKMASDGLELASGAASTGFNESKCRTYFF